MFEFNTSFLFELQNRFYFFSFHSHFCLDFKISLTCIEYDFISPIISQFIYKSLNLGHYIFHIVNEKLFDNFLESWHNGW